MIPARARTFATFAFAAAAATWLGFLTFVLFLVFRGAFGPVNDASGVLLASVQIPVVIGVHQLLRNSSPRWSIVAATLGVIGSAMGVIGLGSLLLKSLIPWDFPEPYAGAGAYGLGILGPGVGGLWQVLVALITLASGGLGKRVGWLCLLAGLGYVLVTSGFTTGGVSSPIGSIGGVLALITGPLWLIGLGRKFRSIAQNAGA